MAGNNFPVWIGEIFPPTSFDKLMTGFDKAFSPEHSRRLSTNGDLENRITHHNRIDMARLSAITHKGLSGFNLLLLSY